MVSKPSNLNNLVTTGALKIHQPTLGEIMAHLTQAKDSLNDISWPGASASGKFKGPYDAAHQLGLAALKMRGFRPKDGFGNRQTVFAALEHAVPATEADQPVFMRANKDRNNAEYEGMPVTYSESENEALMAAVRNLQEEVDLMFRQWKEGQGSPTVSS